MKIGDSVIYIDTLRREHPALLTAIHGSVQKAQRQVDGQWVEYDSIPCVNLVYVSSDESKRDPYGLQLERQSSCVHISSNSAGANCFKFQGE